MPTVPTIAAQLPTSDIGDTMETAGTMVVGTSIYGRIDTVGDRDMYAIHLTAGQALDFRVMGVGFTPLSDTLLTIYDADGNQVSQMDDGNTQMGLSSVGTFSASVDGTYYLEISGYDPAYTGDFLLTVAPNNVDGLVLTVPDIAWELTNHFNTYFTGKSAEQPAQAFDLSSGTLTYDIGKLTTAGAALAVQALQMWADILGVTIAAATGGAAMVDFDDSDASATAYCSTNLAPGNTEIISSDVMVTTSWLATFGTGMNSYSFETYVHELGHALGLGHAGNYNGWAEFGTDNYYLNDSQHLSIMSYMQSLNDEFSYASYNSYINASFRYVLTPMIADIYAIGTLYGLSTTTRTGDTTYGYHSNTGNAALDAAVLLNDPSHQNYVAFTIFDNGGIDTVDMSGFAGDQRIDLHQGASSDVLGGVLNMGIAYGTEVENAIGGTGNDRITGNELGNWLRGEDMDNAGITSGGNDLLQGAEGNDTLVGGWGWDTVYGGQGDDLVILNQAHGWDEVYGGAGNDTASFTATDNLSVALNTGKYTGAGVGGAETHTILGVENVTVDSTGGVTLAGNQLDNVLIVLGSGSGARLDGKAGNDWLVGADHADTLLGGDGSDTLIGGAGADRMDGGDGNDSFWVTTGDKVFEAVGQGYDQVFATGDFVLRRGAEVEFLGYDTPGATTDVNLTGNEFAQTILGSFGNNVLRGGGGGDTLNGLDGDDTLIGGLGTDVMFGGAGNDTFIIADSRAVIYEDLASGYDTILTSANYTLAAGVEIEAIKAKGVSLTLVGNEFAQVMTGGAGNDVLDGHGGADTLIGGAGDDTLTGNNSAVLMTGGSGRDLFSTVVADGALADTLTDFKHGVDTIILHTGNYALHWLDALEFRMNATGLAEAATDRVIYDKSTGDLWFDRDGSDAFYDPVLALHLTNLPQGLTASDFLLA